MARALEYPRGPPMKEMKEVAEVTKELYIDGTWRPASDGALFDVEDPSNGSVLATVASASVTDAIAAVEAAHRAGRDWAARPPRDRGETLRRAFELLTLRKEQFARLMVMENGKALSEARAEMVYAAEFLRWYSEEAVRIEGTMGTAPSGAHRMLVIRQP